ncbi:MAG TPA: hypothetical protein VFZ72_14955, partial [Jiangellaceae bacterium]
DQPRLDAEGLSEGRFVARSAGVSQLRDESQPPERGVSVWGSSTATPASNGLSHNPHTIGPASSTEAANRIP